MPLYISFIDLTKAFDLVSRDGLFKILPKIGCPPKLLSLVTSFRVDMKGTVQFNGSSSEPFSINSGVKQGCVLAPTLFGIFFAICSSNTHLVHRLKESTYVPGQMVICSTSLALKQKLKSAIDSPGTCYLPTIQQLSPTPRKNCKR